MKTREPDVQATERISQIIEDHASHGFFPCGFFMFKANGSPSVRKCNGCQTERPTRHNATVRLKRGSTSSSTSPGNRTPPRTNVTNITDKNYKTETNKQKPQINKKKHNEHNNNKTGKTNKGILSIWRTRRSPVDRLIQHKVLVCQIGG